MGSHRAAVSSAAATDSRRGARAVACLHPRSWSGAPEESTLTVNRSSTARTTTSCSRPSSDPGPSTEVKRSATAPSCQSFECRVVTRTRGRSSGPIHGSQSTSLIQRSRSAKDRTVNRATRTSTRVADRKNRLAAYSCRVVRSAEIEPLPVRRARIPRSSNSAVTTSSRPGGQTTKQGSVGRRSSETISRLPSAT